MTELFAGFPDAIANTERIAERCEFDLTKDLDYRFPDYPVPEGETQESDTCGRSVRTRRPEVFSYNFRNRNAPFGGTEAH